MRRVVSAFLGVLVAALATAAVWIGVQLRAERETGEAREAAVRAAGRHAVNLLSLDYRTVDRDVARILAGSTGQARSEAQGLKESTLKAKAVQTGALRAAGLVSMNDTGDTAQVLVAADSVTRWEGGEIAPQEWFPRWNMRMVKIGEAWLVAAAERVP